MGRRFCQWYDYGMIGIDLMSVKERIVKRA